MALANDTTDKSSPGDRPASAALAPGQPLTQRLARAWRYVRGGAEASSLGASLDAVLAEERDGASGLSAAEQDMFVNLLGFNELRTEDVMVPRPDIVAVEEGTSLDELVKAFREANHSRLPVFSETLDDPRGMVHIKDLLGWMADNRTGGETDDKFDLATIRRDLVYVPPSMPAIDLLLKMQASRVHMALVIDEYGGTDGLVTIEDLVEEIVGEIEDEHDEAERPDLVRLPGGLIDATARAEIGDLEEMLNVTLMPEEREDDLDTLGGLVFDMLGRVPQRGEVVVHETGIEFEIADADPRRIKRLVVHPGATSENPAKDKSDSPTTD
ncbi:MAG: hemolysin family protein [Alphaproteobacteria bacterium]|uniref:hemolysin family protein n=1 Tax=Pyruvatibacter sp. HU-CL02332 TaxID=3127650 RepID=UPI0029697F14|nr:hemolysin family protein [Alphaproteobacteria bacterium]